MHPANDIFGFLMFRLGGLPAGKSLLFLAFKFCLPSLTFRTHPTTNRWCATTTLVGKMKTGSLALPFLGWFLLSHAFTSSRGTRQFLHLVFTLFCGGVQRRCECYMGPGISDGVQKLSIKCWPCKRKSCLCRFLSWLSLVASQLSAVLSLKWWKIKRCWNAVVVWSLSPPPFKEKKTSWISIRATSNHGTLPLSGFRRLISRVHGKALPWNSAPNPSNCPASGGIVFKQLMLSGTNSYRPPTFAKWSTMHRILLPLFHFHPIRFKAP